jgi:hypothetical protein
MMELFVRPFTGLSQKAVFALVQLGNWADTIGNHVEIVVAAAKRSMPLIADIIFLSMILGPS